MPKLGLGALWSMLSPLVANAAGMVNRTTVVATRACLIASLVWDIHFGVEIVGIDETSLRGGQDCITAVHDLNAKRYERGLPVDRPASRDGLLSVMTNEQVRWRVRHCEPNWPDRIGRIGSAGKSSS